MKRIAWILALVLVCGAGRDAWSQGGSPSERKALREYTSPQELVSIAPTTTLDKALSVISEVSQKFVGKVIVDTDRRSIPINVDIQGMHWRDALETILRKNDMWYTEYDNYIQVTNPAGEGAAAAAARAAGGGQQATAPTDIPREFATIKSREVKISAYFFEVNLAKMEEVGINWSFMKSTSDLTVNSQFQGASRVTSELFKTEVTPKLSFANISFLAQLFSNYELGEILSGPQLIVRSGEEGRIQVGQDFSIKERDFAGNIIDKFYSAGTIIKVKSQVVTEQGINFVHLVVDVERSDVQPGQISTIINKTKANTNLLLLDGEETVIGGLYSNQTTTVRSGVPFLKDLPWYVLGLRYLFGYNLDQVTKKELVILIKAEIVPTLQERITQKSKGEGVFDRWEENQLKQERVIKGRRD